MDIPDTYFLDCEYSNALVSVPNITGEMGVEK